MNPVRHPDGQFNQSNSDAVPMLKKNIHVEITPDTGHTDRSVFFYLAIALGIALVIRFFVAAPYIVSGSSMEPNFDNWNYLIVDRLTYRFSAPERGDVIVLNLPEDTHRALIKRIIGLPGDTVQLTDTEPIVTIINTAHPKGFVLKEPYISPSNYGGGTNIKITLGANEYFVLGDNRKVSADSRVWGILPRSDIVGRVLFRLYPLNGIGVLPGTARYVDNTSS
jgi:signal peptidase I